MYDGTPATVTACLFQFQQIMYISILLKQDCFLTLYIDITHERVDWNHTKGCGVDGLVHNILFVLFLLFCSY